MININYLLRHKIKIIAISLTLSLNLSACDPTNPGEPNEFSTATALVLSRTQQTDAPIQLPHSAIRKPGEDYQVALRRLQGPQTRATTTGTAKNVAVPFASLDTSKLTEWSITDVHDGFYNLRDERMFTSYKRDGQYFPRRNSWLLPDDGCFLRAHYMEEKLEEWGYPEVKKLFVFGNLSVSTPNHKNGYVTWVFHVVPVVSLFGQPFVFDAAVDPTAPLSIQDWAKRLGENNEMTRFTYSICHRDTYVTDSNCENPRPVTDWGAAFWMNALLDWEWNRQVNLDRDPQQVLGENPPWLEENN